MVSMDDSQYLWLGTGAVLVSLKPLMTYCGEQRINSSRQERGLPPILDGL